MPVDSIPVCGSSVTGAGVSATGVAGTSSGVSTTGGLVTFGGSVTTGFGVSGVGSHFFPVSLIATKPAAQATPLCSKIPFSVLMSVILSLR